MEIKGKTFLVSGSSSGLGAACAQRLLRAGARVIGLDQNACGWIADRSFHGTMAECYWHGKCDISDEQAVEEVVAQGIERLGEISGLVSCAGILHGERLIGRDAVAKLDSFKRVMEVNVVGTFLLARVAAASILRRLEGTQRDVQDNMVGQDRNEGQDNGALVFTSSIAATEGQVGQIAYAGSKGAVASMTLPMARELARFGIRVVAIAPGVFETPMMQGASPKVRDPLFNRLVYPKRFGEPEEFAQMVEHVFENSMLNGTVLRLDGGLRM
jgi:NAD(P)-dependent dehydrogenase (short-subunit alcohol dehydrogenase family)